MPRTLAVHIPDSVPTDAAALTTIGAIAMQGLRQAGIVFGETVAIIGAGLLGVLAIQMARAAGCRVVAVDLLRSALSRRGNLARTCRLWQTTRTWPKRCAGFRATGWMRPC